MTVFRSRHGFQPLLFDRLSALSRPGDQTIPRSRELQASIQRELTDLLNTRTPLPIDLIEQRKRSTIDYGLPDLSAFPVGNHEAMHRLADHIRHAIVDYEPRLQDPLVEIDPATASTETILVRVSGVIDAGTMRATSVTFALVAGGGAAGDDAA